MRQIILDLCNTATLDNNEPIVLPESLDFEITSITYKLNTLVISARNGNKTEKQKLSGKGIINLNSLAYAGKIELEISNVIGGKVVKSWRVPSIYVVEIEHKFMAIPEIEAIKQEFKAEIDKLKQAIKELNEKIEKQGV